MQPFQTENGSAAAAPSQRPAPESPNFCLMSPAAIWCKFPNCLSDTLHYPFLPLPLWLASEFDFLSVLPVPTNRPRIEKSQNNFYPSKDLPELHMPSEPVLFHSRPLSFGFYEMRAALPQRDLSG